MLVADVLCLASSGIGSARSATPQLTAQAVSASLRAVSEPDALRALGVGTGVPRARRDPLHHRGRPNGRRAEHSFRRSTRDEDARLASASDSRTCWTACDRGSCFRPRGQATKSGT